MGDISNFAHNKIICNSIECLRKRDVEIRKIPKNNNCNICGKDISDLRRDAKTCQSLSCKNKQSVINYHQRFKTKSCINCGKSFKGNDKKLQCDMCAKLKYKNGTQKLIIRRELYPVWVKKVMSRDGFKCKMCKTHSNLEVHHLTPLRKIIKDVLHKHDISNLFLVDSNSKTFQSILSDVINLHTLDIGITLCKQCHAKVDNKRHIKIIP